jgi:hypothetical protein
MRSPSSSTGAGAATRVLMSAPSPLPSAGFAMIEKIEVRQMVEVN